MSINKKWNPCEIGYYTSVTKIQDHLKRQNAEYLQRNPEVHAILRTLLHEAINREATNPAELAATVFNCNTNVLLKTKINKEIQFVVDEMRKSRWEKFDSEDFLTKTDSSQSLLSSSSLVNEMESILRFCLILPRNNN